MSDSSFVCFCIIDEEGFTDIPFLGSANLLGLNIEQIQLLLKDKYEKYCDILLMILETERSPLTKTRMFEVKLLVFDEPGSTLVEANIYYGNWERTCMFIGGEVKTWGGKWPFLNICKAHALWLDYCVKNNVKCK